MKNFKIFALLITCSLLQAVTFTASAQKYTNAAPVSYNSPVGNELLGEWFFFKAQSQERPMGSTRSYSTQSVSQDEFWQKAYFYNMPTQLMFTGFFARISHPSWSKHVVSVINGGKLEFRIDPESPDGFNNTPDLDEIESYHTMMPVYDFAIDGGIMSLKSEYFYPDGNGSYIEGILTVFYKK